jgi:hypothetical protein
MPTQPINKGIPGPGLLADVLISKYQDAMPLYRQMLRFARHQIDISDSTLCDWIGECAFLLEPIVNEIKKDLLLSLKIHSDDTPIPVMSKGKTRQGRLWVYLADGCNTAPCIVYDYTPTRSQQGPLNFLKNYKGFLQADAYSGYDVLFPNGSIIEVACWAHARRKFFEVVEAAQGESQADEMLQMIGKLYLIEKAAKFMTPVQRYYYRKHHSKPILRQIRRWLNRMNKTVMPNTPIAKAIAYNLNHWIAFTRFLKDGHLDLDNNKAERAVRPLKIGAKNWLFFGNNEGGRRAAIIYSIIETCKQNSVNTFDYLKDVLTKIPIVSQTNIKQLLPYNWRPSQ